MRLPRRSPNGSLLAKTMEWAPCNLLKARSSQRKVYLLIVVTGRQAQAKQGKTISIHSGFEKIIVDMLTNIVVNYYC